MSDYFYLFTTRRFLPLFITQFLGALNDTTFKNSFLIWLTYTHAASSPLSTEMMLALGSALFILPFVLFSPLAGEMADKYQKASLCRLIKFYEIFLMGGVGLAFFWESSIFLMVLLFLAGLQSTFFGPIKYSLLPEHLKDTELIGGNGFIEMGTFLAILLGTLLGGLLVLLPNGIFLLSGFLFVSTVAGWRASCFIPPAPVGDPTLRLSFNIPRQYATLFTQATLFPGIIPLILLISWFWFLGALFLMLLPEYTKTYLHADESVVTLFLSIFSIGIGCGAVACNALLKGEIHTRLVPATLLGMGLGLALFCGATLGYEQALSSGNFSSSLTLFGFLGFVQESLWSLGILGGLLILSVSGGLYIVPLYARLQHRTPDYAIARMIAVNNVFNSLFIASASLFAMGLFAVGLNAFEVLSSTGLGIFVVLLFVLLLRKRMSLL